MKKVLFIAYLYPPIANSGTQRSLKFANYLSKFGWEPILLTVDDPPEVTIEAKLMDEIRPGLRIERVPFYSRQVASTIANLIPVKNKTKIISALEWRIRLFWTIPDLCYMWRPSAVQKAIELYKKEKFDLIYASGSPWSSFLIARDIHEKTGVPYILDYRDLWTHIQAGWDTDNGLTSKISHWIHCAYESYAVKKAAGVISVSTPIVEKLRRILKTTDYTYFTCITNGFDPGDYPNSTKPFPQNKFNIVYTGIWKKGYSPEHLFQALELICKDNPDLAGKICVHAAGFPPEKGENYKINGVEFNAYGRVEHKKALNLIQKADLLYLPVAEGEYANVSLPGKFWEYLGSRSPILAAVPKDSEVAKVLEKTGNSIWVDHGSVIGIKEIIIRLLREGTNKNISKCNEEEIRKYERKEQAKQLATFLNHCLKQGRL